MSISEAQHEANRLNAQKSTGPATPEGKKRASLNGMRHGLTGVTFLMANEDREAYDAFSEPFIESLKPANPAELQFAHLIAKDHFRLNRIQAIEENTFALGHYGKAGQINVENNDIHSALTQARVFALEGKLFQNLSLYEQRITRNMHKNLKGLQDLQDRRRSEEREAALEAEKAAAKPKVKAATVAPEPDSVDLSNRPGLIDTEAETKTPNRGHGFGISRATAPSEIVSQSRENAPLKAA